MNTKNKICSVILISVFIPLCFVSAVEDPLDSDSDGLSDELEKYYYTDPFNSDTDNDGYLDGEEVVGDYSPHLGNKKRLHEGDYDGDGLNDWLERWFGSDLGVTDSDGDGVEDLDEVLSGSSPAKFGTSTEFERHVVVDRSWQRLYYYVDGVKIKNFPVSTGIPYLETPGGEFSVTGKIPVKRYVGSDYDLPNVWWNLEFFPMYYIHAAYWHNNFGMRTESHGCVNMRFKDAELLYRHIDVGVPITVTGTTPSRFYVGT